jgi:PAT family beta-lactamase induction signal transducer AmpG
VVGHDPLMLALTIGAENFTGGMGAAAFVAYLSGLTNVAFTATQYALLSSLAAVPAKFLASPSGWLASELDWVAYFIFTAAAALPGLLMIAWLMRRFPLAPAASPRPALAVDD